MKEHTALFEVLYKMDSKGKIRRWEVLVGSDVEGHYYEQVHGLVDGKLQSAKTYVNEGKNIGKANETTVEEQTILEAQSLWNKKKDRSGYSTEIPTDKPKLPMLAKSYDKDAKKIEFPALTQPKLDGIRCIMSIDMSGNILFKSRQNKEFTTLCHVADSWNGHDIQRWLGFSFDGELYNHEMKDDFQGIISAIKRDKPSDKTHLIQYHIYDVCSDRDFHDRNSMFLDDLRDNYVNDFIKVVDTHAVESHDEFLVQYHSFMEQGYEGAMIRNRAGSYQYNRRSPDLQKYKSFKDAEFEIIGAYQNKGKMANQCTFLCVTEEGYEFGVKPKGTEAQREQYWTDYQAGKLTGKMMTVKFFDWTTSEKPVPRFPVGVSVRDYE